MSDFLFYFFAGFTALCALGVIVNRNAVNAARGTSAVVTALNKVSDAAIGTRVAAETVLTASDSVDASVGSLRAEIESFLNKVAV